MLEAFLKYLVTSGCFCVRVRPQFNTSWQESMCDARAWAPGGPLLCVMGLEPLFFLGDPRVQSLWKGHVHPLLLSWYLTPAVPELSSVCLRIDMLLLVIFLYRRRFSFLLHQFDSLSFF